MRHCARGCRADGKGRPASPAPTLFGERLGCAEQNTELTQNDRIVEIMGRTSYESIKWSMISFQSRLPAFSPPEAAPLNHRLGARVGGVLKVHSPAEELDGGVLSQAFLSLGCWGFSIFYGIFGV